MNNKTKGLMSVLIPVITWGISFVSTEYLLDYMGPMSIGAVRFLIATGILYIMMRRTGTSLKIEKKDHLLFILAGGIGIAIYFYFENTGIKYISASPAALIIAAIPIFTLIFEALIYKRPVKAMDTLAIIVSIIGVMLIVDIKIGEFFSSGESFGYVMMIGAVASWIVYSMASKPLFKRYSYLTIIFYQFFYSMPFFLIAMPFESNQWHLLGPVGIAHLIFLSLFASVLGFYYYAKAMDLLGVTESSVFINFLPIVTIVFSYFYMGQIISIKQLIGGLFVMLSVTVTTLHEKKLGLAN
jgi:drug/metabolite transporter (DMT)-like permease